MALTSITSLDSGSLFNPEGTDGAPYDIFKLPYFGTDHQFTQDLRLTSSSGGPFDYIVGAYYQHEDIYNSTQNQVYNFLDESMPANYEYCAASCLRAGAGVGYASGMVINPGCVYHNSFDQIRNSWAVYSDDCMRSRRSSSCGRVCATIMTMARRRMRWISCAGRIKCRSPT